MMSVFKFHVAVTVLKKMEREGIGLDSTVLFDTAKLQKDTWSPLLKERPDQIVCLSFAEILEYMVSHSDNNMCNWLIDFVGGISEVASCIRSLGIEDFRLTETEKSMQEDIYRSYCNWTTPLAMTELLRKVYTGNVLSPEHLSFLVKAMKGSSSGQNKIRSALPEGVEFAHKTGSSFRTPEGVQMCEADAGVIYMPDGTKAYVAVFIKDSMESDADNAAIIAAVGRVIYDSLAACE